MRIRLLAFATAAEAVGRGEREIDVPEGAKLADLESILVRDYPALARHWTTLALAVDGELSDGATPLSEGCEVALLPPVSGGNLPVDPLPRDRLVEGPIDIERIRRRVADTASGAVLVFVGAVRDSHEGRPVTQLTYDAYRPMAAAALEKIVREIEAMHQDSRLEIVHRLGNVTVGEASVVIACSSPHRDAAYKASRRALERLKAEVPIWKREHYADGAAVWREEESLAG